MRGRMNEGEENVAESRQYDLDDSLTNTSGEHGLAHEPSHAPIVDDAIFSGFNNSYSFHTRKAGRRKPYSH